MSQRAGESDRRHESDRRRLTAMLAFCGVLILAACGGGGDTSSSRPSEARSPARAADSSPPATLLNPQFDPCDYFSEEDYAAVMGAPPETVRRGEAGRLRTCTREHAAPDNMASVQVAKAPETLLNNILETARNADVRPTPIEAPSARVYFMDETKTLYAYKDGVYLEVVVRAPEDFRGKTIEVAKRALAHIR